MQREKLHNKVDKLLLRLDVWYYAATCFNFVSLSRLAWACRNLFWWFDETLLKHLYCNSIEAPTEAPRPRHPAADHVCATNALIRLESENLFTFSSRNVLIACAINRRERLESRVGADEAPFLLMQKSDTKQFARRNVFNAINIMYNAMG